MDTKDWDGFRELFTPDVVDRRERRRRRGVRGRRCVPRHAAPALADVETVHHGHMPEIEITSPTAASGIWAMEDRLRFADVGADLDGARLRPLSRHVREVRRRPLADRLDPPHPAPHRGRVTSTCTTTGDPTPRAARVRGAGRRSRVPRGSGHRRRRLGAGGRHRQRSGVARRTTARRRWWPRPAVDRTGWRPRRRRRCSWRTTAGSCGPRSTGSASRSTIRRTRTSRPGSPVAGSSGSTSSPAR